MIVHVKLPRSMKPPHEERVVIVEWPVVPREGEYVASDKDDFRGVVRSVSYYVDEFEEFITEIALRA